MPDDAQQLEIDNLFYVHIWKSEHFKGDYNTAKQAPLCNQAGNGTIHKTWKWLNSICTPLTHSLPLGVHPLTKFSEKNPISVNSTMLS